MNSRAFITRHQAWAGLLMPILFAAACAPTSDFQQVQDQQFEIRSMVASNQQSIQALDQRLRQLEDQLQEMQHGGDSGSGPSNAALAKRIAKLEAGMNALRNGNPAAPGASVPSGPGGMPGIPAGSLPPGEGTVAPGAAAPGNPVPPSAGTVPPGANPNAAGLLGGSGTPAGNDEGGGSGGEEVASAPPEAAPAPVVEDTWRQDLNRAMAAAQSDTSAPGKLYRGGLDLMQKGQYATAIDRFSQLQKRYPHSDLSEPADYFAAISYSQLGKHDQAILQFNDLVMRFPKGNYAGSALLREAQAFIQINDKIDARLTLQKLLNEHADSPEASAASALMKNLEAD